ncbi:unnamed protein product [Parascedosporium putredinis]|uniref:Uncharacterized protein n=1 Tax=Parascedosporium putredinis TaxID=1442378 RepID=A0A9P1M980_9PEZI|nr:unnamed protein product [Parascedosporium putredinis]CAI7994154.1 unnamed protein product [Parascedosporium putredinis]
MLHEAVGPNALAHKELSVSAVTFLSVLTILVKVSCSQLPWYFRAWAGCYLFGWLTVQVLLIMFHFGGDIRDSDLETLVRYGRWLSKLEDYDSLRWEIDDTRGGLKFVIGIFLMVIPRTMAAGIVGSSLVMLIVGAIMDVLHSIKNSATLISKTKTLPILLGWVALNLLFWFGWISSFINFMVSHESLDKVPLWTTTRLTEESIIAMCTFRAISVLFCALLWLFGPPASGEKQPEYEVNIAAAYASVIWYLDEKNHIIKASGPYEGGEYGRFHSDDTGSKSSSGLATVQVGSEDSRCFYINDTNHLIQQANDTNTPLGPKVAKGSSIYAVVPVQSSDIHLFYLAEDRSLASLTWQDGKWSEVLDVLPNFATDPTTRFAAAAWLGPWFVRVFSINKDRSITEWTLTDTGSSENTTDRIQLTIDAVAAGQPVAASRSVEDNIII